MFDTAATSQLRSGQTYQATLTVLRKSAREINLVFAISGNGLTGHATRAVRDTGSSAVFSFDTLGFYGTRGAMFGYVSASTLQELNTAPRYNFNDIFGRVVIAPQVFYYEPQKLWYFIAQIPANDERPNLKPVYSTNPDIENVHGWSAPQVIPTKKENDDFWIDFWVICDDRNAHLFYTDHRGSMFRMETPLDRFPDFSASLDETVLTERGENERGRWRLHEASHIYYVRSANQYLCLLEAIYFHPTRPGYWDSRSRFMFAMVADKLEGPWRRVEDSPNSFAGDPARLFLADGTRAKYGQVSHFEIIRPGYDQRFEIPDFNFVLFFQGFDASDTPDNFVYDDLPWELALMKNYEGDWSERLPDPVGYQPTQAPATPSEP